MRRHASRCIPVLLAVLLAPACAPNRRTDEDGRFPAYNARPRLISCDRDTPIPVDAQGARRTLPVKLRFVVATDGRIDMGSIVPVPAGGGIILKPEQVDRAKRLAGTCLFEPAERGMERVAAPYEMTFRVLRPNA